MQCGSDVKALQAALIKAGYGCGKGGADGKFGHYTMLAVRALQSDKWLTVKSVAGKADGRRTWWELERIDFFTHAVLMVVWGFLCQNTYKTRMFILKSLKKYA